MNKSLRFSRALRRGWLGAALSRLIACTARLIARFGGRRNPQRAVSFSEPRSGRMGLPALSAPSAVLSPQPCLHPYTVRGDADVRASCVELCICRNLPSLPWSPERCLLVSQATRQRPRGVSLTVTSKPRPSTTRVTLLGLPTLSRGLTEQHCGAPVQTGTPFHVPADGAALGPENPAPQVRSLLERPPPARLVVGQSCDALTVHSPLARIPASVDGFQPVGTTTSGLIVMARRVTATQS